MNILLVRGKPTFMDMIVGIPIGLVYIAPIAQKKGHHVEILDLALEQNPEEVLNARLQERRWDVAGFTCMTAEFEGAEVAARQVKAFDPSIRTIFGGQHPTIVTEEVVSADCCDFVCMGEGEETFGEFLEVWRPEGTLRRLPAWPSKTGIETLESISPGTRSGRWTKSRFLLTSCWSWIVMRQLSRPATHRNTSGRFRSSRVGAVPGTARTATTCSARSSGPDHPSTFSEK